MVGGKIVDFYRLKSGSETVRFLARGTGGEANDYCCVKAKIPEVVFKNLEIGNDIWWHHPYVYIKVFGVDDAKFDKVGYSGGDQEFFYKNKPVLI